MDFSILAEIPSEPLALETYNASIKFRTVSSVQTRLIGHSAGNVRKLSGSEHCRRGSEKLKHDYKNWLKVETFPRR